MAKKKTEFYRVRWNRCGLNVDRASQVLNVTPEQVQDWDEHGNELATRFLMLWDSKRVGVEGWDGFLFSRGVLRFKSRRWTPKSLLLWFDQSEELEALRGEILRLKTWRGLSTVFVEKLVSKDKRL
jgi:hypothetical protein